MELADDTLETFETFALELADAAAAAILPLFRADHGLIDKGLKGDGKFDPVTHADRSAEAAIRAVVSRAYPGHGFIGEEYGEDRPDAPFVWVLDPIDGTRAFISGLPVWTTLIALRHHGRPVVGLIGQSFLGEAFVGSRRGAARVTASGREALRVRACPDLKDALAATTDPYLFTGPAAGRFAALRSAVKLVRFGCDAYAYAMAALGALDLVVETGLKAWDIEAAIPVIEGAGGVISHWSGQPIGQAGGDLLIAGDARIHRAAVEILSG